MREILFRGKRVDNGEWIEGNLYESKMSGCYILIPQVKVRQKDGAVIGDTFTVHEVAHETVGQFTGIYDKNGKPIFEGDILSYIKEIETRSGGKETLKVIYEVKFDYCGFPKMDCLACNHLEIIGNIHDNQELLKGGEK